MNEEMLEAQVEIILRKEYDDLARGIATFKLDSKTKKQIVYPHSETLAEIFSNIQNKPRLKRRFFELLGSRILKSKDYNPQHHSYNKNLWASKVPICFYTLLILGFSKEIAELVRQRGKLPSLTLLRLLDLILEEGGYFNTTEIHKLSQGIEKMKSNDIEPYEGSIEFSRLKKNIKSKILIYGYARITKEIKGINLEINRDKKTVSEKVEFLDFDPKYNDLLNDIDKYLNTETSNVLNSGMINNLRVFMNDILIDIAEKIAKKNKIEVPKTAQSPIGNARNYLKLELKLKDNEHKFVNNFIDILHTEGGHAFTSNKEYFRLSRNIAIEIILLILSKCENIINKRS